MSPGSPGCRLDELCEQIDARLIGDGERTVERVRLPEEAGPQELAFAPHPRFLRRVNQTRAAALLCELDFAAEHADELPCAVLASENPALSLAKAFEVLNPPRPGMASIDDRAAIHVDARLGPNVSVGPFAFVGRAELGAGVRIAAHAYVDDDVVLGEATRVGPGAVVLRGTRLGPRCIVHPGAILGDSGFRYAPDGERNVRVPQPAGVEIGPDVEIGANATVDRGDLRDTVVGEGTRIDNHVQVGHGVQIGRHSVLVGHTAVGGDCVLGDRVVLAGQVGVVPYLTIGDDARIGGKSGVTRDVPAKAARSGIPAYDHAAWLKTSARNSGVDDVVRRLKFAENELEALRVRLDELQGPESDP